MMEKGFYNPEMGYWQTVGGEPTVADYPAGTIEVPVKPSAGHELIEGEWVYKAPPEPTPEELREQMPVLSRRQFWLAADKIGISKADVMASANDNQLRIEIEESTEFHRTYESVVMLAPMLGITPEQLDDIWLWASAA